MTLKIEMTFYPIAEKKIEILTDKCWHMDVLQAVQSMMSEVSHHNESQLFLDLKLSRKHLTFVPRPDQKEIL